MTRVTRVKNLILAAISIALFSGCLEKEIVYVDANGTVINNAQKYRQIKEGNEIVCDSRGYAYYEHYVSGNSSSYNLTPILENHTYGAYQVLCKDLK